MNLQYFPMDRQRCTIEAESYGYNVKDIIYRWARKDTAVERDKEISLPQFDIVQTVQKYRLEELSSGTYSRLIAEIHFARRMGYYLIQIYIPSSLIVVISWVSFWLHRNASPARVQLGVTTVLTMTTLMSSTNAALPKISYVKSIDIFLGTCFVMVFAALLEYATVGYLGKRIAMRKAHAQHAQAQAQAKLFAQLQAQGAEGESVGPLGAIIPTTTAAPGGQTTGNLGLFGNSTEPNGGNGLMCSRSSPLDALLSDPSLYAAAAAAATAAVDQQQRVQHQNYHSNGRPQATADCQQASPQMCSCSKHNNAQTHHSNRHCPATMISHHCHSHQQPASQPAANCSYQQQQQHHHHHHHCRHHNHGPHDEHREQPQAPPRRNLPLHRQQKAPLDLGAGANSNNNINNNSSASCQQCHSSGGQNFKASSQTLPRNLTFAHDEYHSPSVAAAPFATTTRPNAACCRPQRQQQPPSYVCGSIPAPPSSQRQQAATLSAANLAQMSLGPAASPSKGASAAAAAAAATFVNLHRRNKGLPPSTNPNFAHFGAAQPLAAPYNRHLETIFGIRPSDIDKYSRVVFPVCFVCFQLMYWIVYLHISAFLEPDQQQQQPAATAALQAQQPPTPTT